MNNNEKIIQNNQKIRRNLGANEHYLKVLPVRGTMAENTIDFTFPTRMDTKDKHSLIKTDGRRVQLLEKPAQPTSSTATGANTSISTPIPNRRFSSLISPTTVGTEQSMAEETAVKGCVIRANEAIPPSCGIFYFECTVLSDDGIKNPLSVGYISANVSLNFMPGTTSDRYSYCYESTGNVFSTSCCAGEKYASSFSVGDTVGCCLNFINQSIYFTKNGTHLGLAFRRVQPINFYPSVALSHSSQSVYVNFGSQPFKYNLQHAISEGKESVMNWIEETPVLPVSASLKTENDYDLDDVLRTLVLSHLVYSGYAQTATIFARDSNVNLQLTVKQELQESVIDQMARRQQVSNSILLGDISTALFRLEQWYPGLLRSRFDVEFKLKCHNFIEIYLSGSIQDAINYGQQELVTLVERELSSLSDTEDRLSPKASSVNMSMEDDEQEEDSEDEEEEIDDEDAIERLLQHEEQQQKSKETLQMLFSLLAYTDPSDSPMAYLLDFKSQREEVEQIVNQAILEFESSQSPLSPFAVPLMEKIISQSETCLTVLAENHSRECGPSFISYKDFL